MSAVIMLLASIGIALFFIGPFLSARFIESLVIKQPARTQIPTEELARSLFFSIPFVAVAVLVVWLTYRHHYVFDSNAVDSIFGDASKPSDRWAGLNERPIGRMPRTRARLRTTLLNGKGRRMG